MAGVASSVPPLHNDQLGILPDIPFDTWVYNISPEDQALISNVIHMFDMHSQAVLSETDTHGDILYRMAAYVPGFVVWPGIPKPDTCPLK